MFKVKKIDHIVITTAKPEECIAFYSRLGFEARDGGGRYELFAGDFKINLHILGKELSPHAKNVTVGSADLCFEVEGDIAKVEKFLVGLGIEIELSIVKRTGVKGEMQSIYLRDPDGNLVEFCAYAL